jgi:hypothetical protein
MSEKKGKRQARRKYPLLARATDPEKMAPDQKGHSIDLLEPLGEGEDAETKLIATLRFLEPERAEFEKYATDATAKMFAYMRLQGALANIENGDIKEPDRAGEIIEGYFKSTYNTLSSAADIFFEMLKKCQALIDETPISKDRFMELFNPMSISGTQRLIDGNEEFLSKLQLTGVELGN